MSVAESLPLWADVAEGWANYIQNNFKMEKNSNVLVMCFIEVGLLNDIQGDETWILKKLIYV